MQPRDNADPVRVRGWATRYDAISDATDTQPRVQILPGAADLNSDIGLCVAHDARFFYASTADQTLRLWSTRSGLAFEAELPSTMAGLSLAIGIRNGTLGAVSACWAAGRQSKLMSDEMGIVEVIERSRIDEISLCGAGRMPGCIAWLDCDNDLPSGLRQARALWTAQRMAHELQARRFVAKTKARGPKSAWPPARLLAEIDEVLALVESSPLTNAAARCAAAAFCRSRLAAAHTREGANGRRP